MNGPIVLAIGAKTEVHQHALTLVCLGYKLPRQVGKQVRGLGRCNIARRNGSV